MVYQYAGGTSIDLAFRLPEFQADFAEPEYGAELSKAEASRVKHFQTVGSVENVTATVTSRNGTQEVWFFETALLNETFGWATVGVPTTRFASIEISATVIGKDGRTLVPADFDWNVQVSKPLRGHVRAEVLDRPGANGNTTHVDLELYQVMEGARTFQSGGPNTTLIELRGSKISIEEAHLWVKTRNGRVEDFGHLLKEPTENLPTFRATLPLTDIERIEFEFRIVLSNGLTFTHEDLDGATWPPYGVVA